VNLARHVKKASTLTCFIRAHIMAQNDLVKYYGGNGLLDEIEEAELARTVLQSQVATYKAQREAAASHLMLGPDICKELHTLVLRRAVAKKLSSFVETAHRDGAISANEAHAILHPMNHHIAECIQTLHDRTEGVVDNPHRKSRKSVDNGQPNISANGSSSLCMAPVNSAFSGVAVAGSDSIPVGTASLSLSSSSSARSIVKAKEDDAGFDTIVPVDGANMVPGQLNDIPSSPR
jgi:hypothetical protein